MVATASGWCRFSGGVESSVVVKDAILTGFLLRGRVPNGVRDLQERKKVGWGLSLNDPRGDQSQNILSCLMRDFKVEWYFHINRMNL